MKSQAKGILRSGSHSSIEEEQVSKEVIHVIVNTAASHC